MVESLRSFPSRRKSGLATNEYKYHFIPNLYTIFTTYFTVSFLGRSQLLLTIHAIIVSGESMN